jgi:hypothetical protein
MRSRRLSLVREDASPREAAQRCEETTGDGDDADARAYESL